MVNIKMIYYEDDYKKIEIKLCEYKNTKELQIQCLNDLGDKYYYSQCAFSFFFIIFIIISIYYICKN